MHPLLLLAWCCWHEFVAEMLYFKFIKAFLKSNTRLGIYRTGNVRIRTYLVLGYRFAASCVDCNDRSRLRELVHCRWCAVSLSSGSSDIHVTFQFENTHTLVIVCRKQRQNECLI